MENRIKILTGVGALVFMGSAVAGPIYSTSCESAKGIRIPSNSSGFFMSNDCKVAYILPPSKGISKVNGRTVGVLGRCDEVSQFNRALKKVNNEINKVLSTNIDDQKLKTLFDQRKNIIEQYSDLQSTFGARVELSFSNGIGENLRSFQNMNPNADVTFVPIALKNAELAWNQAKSFDPSMKISFNESLPITNLNNVGAGSFNASLDLSLIGACPLVDSFERTIPDNLKIKDVAGIITPNFVYQYEMAATYKYTAEYNLASLAKKIRTSSSSGGIFKTSSSSSLLETAESSGWFKFNMECDNESICEQAKTETANSIKQRLLKEVLDNIAIGTIGTVVAPVEAGIPGKNGASVAADGLRKCTNVYCQAGAVVLDVASAVFGGTSKTDSYIKQNNHFVKEEVTEKRPVTFTGMMGFGQ